MERKFNKIPKRHIKSGDTVVVIAGNHKGKTGKVIQVLVKEGRVIVDNVNIVKKHVKPTAQNPQGEIREMEAPIHISNVMLIDPATGNPTRTGRKLNEAGKLQRYSKTTGKFV